MTKKPSTRRPTKGAEVVAASAPSKAKVSTTAKATSKPRSSPTQRAKAPAKAPADQSACVLSELIWSRACPEAGQIVLRREGPKRYAAKVVMAGLGEMDRRAADLETLIGWLEALEPPLRELAPVLEGAEAAACLAEDRLEDLLVRAERQALREKFDQLRGEALACWSEIEGKDSP